MAKRSRKKPPQWPRLVLSVDDGSGISLQRVFEQEQVVVGSVEGVDLRVEARGVAAYHAAIAAAEQGGVALRDLRGQPVLRNGVSCGHEIELHHGDRVAIGSATLVVGIGAAPNERSARDTLRGFQAAVPANRVPAAAPASKPAAGAVQKTQQAKAERAVAALLAESRKGARAVGEGRFRLDYSRALDKIKRFQLTDPHRYVLELVQAAVASGTLGVDIDMDADDMHMRFDKRYSGEELGRLFDHIFVSDPAHARISQLAVGVNAALALRPKFIIVESGDGKQGTRLRLSTHEDLDVQALSGAGVVDGTHIHVRERKSFQVLLDAIRGNAEERLLAEHCTRCPVPLRLQGKDLRRDLASDAICRLRFDDAASGRRIELVLPRAPAQRSRITLARNGVDIVQAEVQGGDAMLALGFVGHLDDPALALNASRSDVQRDNNYQKMLSELRRAARQLVIEALGGGAVQRLAPGRRRSWLREAAAYISAGKRGDRSGDPKIARAVDMLLDEPDLVELAYYQPNPDGTRGEIARGPLRAFVEAGEPIRQAPRRFTMTRDDIPAGPLHSVAFEPTPWLRHVFACRVEQAASYYIPLEQTAKNRAERLARRREATLSSARMLLARARIESETPPMVGEIGLDLVVGDEAEDKQGVEVTFLREGVPLDTHLVRDKHIHGVAVIDSPQFEPTAHWDGIKRNAAFRAVGKVIGNSTAALCEALCQTFAKLPPPAELATLMIWDASAGARSEPQRMGLLWGWPQDKTSRRAREVAERLLHKMPRLDAEQAPWLWRWPLFHTLEGRPIALEELEAARQQHRFVYFVGGVHWGETDLPVAGDAPVVNASDGQRRLLRKYFPEGTRSLAKALESRRAHLEQRAAIDAVRARNLVRARLRRGKPELSPHTCSEIMDLPAEGGVVGQIGLLRSPRVSTMSVFVPDSEAGDDAARAALPLLEEIPLDTPVPLQVAALAPDIEPDERFFGPQRGPALTRLLALARAQIEPLLCTLATRRGDALGPSERDVLWVYLADLATKTRRGHEPTLPEPIEQAPLLETLCHGSRALADARAEAEETGRLLVVDKATHPRTQLSERPIFVCAGDLRATLVRLVGAQTVDYSAQLIKEQAAIARSQAPRENPRIPPGHLAVVPVVGPDIIGDLALDEATAMNWKAASSAVRVLVDGRPIERRDVYLDGLPAKAVISSPRFTPDRFFTRVRDDEAWRDGERALRAAADRLVRLICERLLSDSTRGGRALQDIEREALASALQRVAADRFRGDPSVELDGASEADWALAHAPAWPLCPSGSYGGLVELARSMRESGELLYVRTADGHPAAGRVIARAPAEVTRRALLAIFGGSRLRVARETLERDEKAYQRREKAPEALRLSRGEVFAPAAIEWRGAGARAVDGELGLARDHLATPGIVVDCAVDGRQFGRWNVPAPLAAQATLDCRGLSADWADNIFRDADDGALLEQLLRDALWRAVAELARGARALTRWRPSDRAQRQHLILALASTIPMRDPPAGLLELLATAPLFESTAHQQLTAQQLLSRARNDDRLLVVSDLLSPGEPMDGRLIVRADEAGRAALEALAGERFERHDEIWKQELLGMERRQKALPSEPFLSGASAVRSQFSRGDISGVAGLLQPDLYGDSASRVRLNVGRRPVVVREPTWTPAIEVWINCDRLQPNRAFDDVTEDAVYAEVMAVAEAQRVDLVLRAAQSQSFRVSTALRDRLQLYVARAAADLARARDEQDDEAARLLLDTPIWRCIDESGPREVSTEALIAAAREQRLARVESIERRTPPRGGPLLFCTSAEITRAWNQQLGLALPDYSAKLDALEARRTFLERPQEKIDLAAQLGVGLFARGPLGELDGVAHEGEIALDYGRSNNLRVTAFVENRRAGEQTIPSRVSAAAVVQGPCVALDAHALLVRGERWSAMLRDLRHRAEELLLQVLREQKASPADLDAGRRAGLLLLETIQREQQQQLDSEPDGKRKSKRASKRKGKGKSSDTDDDHTLRIDTSRLAERDAEIVGTLRALPLVKGIDEQWLSLDALCDSGEPVGIIPPEADQGPEPWLQGSVVVVDRVQASALRALIGARDVEPLYNQLVQARRRRESAPDRAEVDWRATVVRAKIGRGDLHGDLRGELGLGIPYGRTALTLMSRGRVVETIQPEGATGFVGWLDGPFETDERFTRVLVDESLRGAISELYLERCQAAVRSCLDEKPRSHARYRTLAAHSAHHVLTPLAGMARHACREAVLSGVSPHFDDLTRRLLEAPIIEDVDGRFHSLSQLAARDATFVCCAPDAEERGADRGNALLLRTYGAAILHMLLVLVHGDERVMSLGSWEREQTRAAKVRRAAAERVSANERLMWGLQVALREGVQASGGRHGLTLPLVNSLGLAPDGGARGALVKHDGQQWRLNPKSSTWREAAAAETAGVSSAYYLAAATLRHVSTPELVADQLAALAKAALG